MELVALLLVPAHPFAIANAPVSLQKESKDMVPATESACWQYRTCKDCISALSFCVFCPLGGHWSCANDKNYKGQTKCHSPKTCIGRVCIQTQCPAPPEPPNWPRFTDSAMLAVDPWGRYFEHVYGEIPSTGYPLDVGDLWMLYNDVLALKDIRIPRLSGKCPTNRGAVSGQRYMINSMFDPPNVSWIWHPYPYSGFLGNTWIEVTHEADPFGDEHFGSWFMYAKGSGIWLNNGKTLAFMDHQDAYTYFKVRKGDINEELSKAAAAHGFDTIQFLAHVDPIEYANCDTHHTGEPGLNYMNIEVLAVKLVGTYSCTVATSGVSASIRAGWDASKSCTCNNTIKTLNCEGVPLLRDPTTSWVLKAWSKDSFFMV